MSFLKILLCFLGRFGYLTKTRHSVFIYVVKKATLFGYYVPQEIFAYVVRKFSIVVFGVKKVKYSAGMAPRGLFQC